MRVSIPLDLCLLALIVLSGCYTSPESAPEETVSHLIVLLQDPSPDIRRTSALSLGKIATPHAADSLVEHVHDADALVRQYCAWALGNLGEEMPVAAIPHLIKLLSDPDPEVARTAGQAIGKSGAAVAVPPLLNLLSTDNPVARLAAVEALAWLEAPGTYSGLVATLQDSHASIRQAALAALGELGDQRAVPLLEARLRADADVGVRSEAAYRLGKLGNERSLGPLRSAIEEQNEDQRVKRWAKWAIAQLSGPGAPESTTGRVP